MTEAPRCDYLVPGDEAGRSRRPCGGLAAFVRNGYGGLFHYCEHCARVVREDCERRQIKLNLRRIA